MFAVRRLRTLRSKKGSKKGHSAFGKPRPVNVILSLFTLSTVEVSKDPIENRKSFVPFRGYTKTSSAYGETSPFGGCFFVPLRGENPQNKSPIFFSHLVRRRRIRLAGET
jgi:hypothetical protein